MHRAAPWLGLLLPESEAARPVQTFAFPVHAWDAWVTLHQVRREPLRLNQDGSIPLRWIRPLEARLPPVPDWLGVDAAPLVRVTAGIQLLRNLGIIQERKLRREIDYLPCERTEPVAQAGWLAFRALSLAARQLEVLDPDLPHLPSVCANLVSQLQWNVRVDGPVKDLGIPLVRRLLGCLPAHGARLHADVVEAFRGRDPFVPDPFGTWSSRSICAAPETYLDRIAPSDSDILLGAALAYPTVLGLIERGFDAQGRHCLGISAEGRTYLGLEPVATERNPHILLTPAYDLVFGRPDAEALAWCSLVLETTGMDHGAVGKLTAASIHRAVSLGLDLAAIFELLEPRLAAPLPGNVRATLEGWVARARPVLAADGTVLTCPDASVADELERLARGQAKRLSATHLFLSDRKLLATLRRKAGEKGILL